MAALKAPGSRTKSGPIEIAYPGPGHTSDNLVVYVPNSKILFGGGLIRGKDQTSLGNIRDADMKTWPQSLRWTLQTYGGASLVVPSYGQGADISLATNTLALLAKTINAKADAKQTQDTAGK